MVSALVLVNSDLDAQDRVIESLRQVGGVEEAHALYGVYNLIFRINAVSIDKIRKITKLKIKPIADVNSSLTLMIVQDD
jgi:DNA-binding Lrp family transcriptional regulator